MNCVLALDQSTSATKALLFEKDGRLVDKVSRDHRQLYPRPGWVEHDAEEIWRNTLDTARELLDRHRNRISDLACLSLSNQRETIVAFDRATGRPVHPAIVWQCRRGDAICRELIEAGHEPRVTSLTGLRLDTYFSGSKAAWLVREYPELRSKLASGEVLLGTIDAYLVYRLTGGRVFATDPTNACRTLLYDIHSLRWDPWLCDCFGVPLRALPEVRESGSEFGATTLDGWLSEPLSIRGVMGDSQASLFAQRCFEPGMAKVTLGTGCSVLFNVGDVRRDPPAGLVLTLAWVRDGQATYSFEGIINVAAASLTWLKDQLGLMANAREASGLAASVPDNGGVYLVPAFSGLGAPYWRPTARAAIVGLTGHSSRQHVVRAAEESIAYQVRDVLTMMTSAVGTEGALSAGPAGSGTSAVAPDASWIRMLYADGGATADRFLMQFMADLLDAEIHAADLPDGSPLGAALAGMLGSGMHGSLAALRDLPRAVREYRPAMDRAMAQRYYDGWLEAVRRVF